MVTLFPNLHLGLFVGPKKAFESDEGFKTQQNHKILKDMFLSSLFW